MCPCRRIHEFVNWQVVCVYLGKIVKSNDTLKQRCPPAVLPTSYHYCRRGIFDQQEHERKAIANRHLTQCSARARSKKKYFRGLRQKRQRQSRNVYLHSKFSCTLDGEQICFPQLRSFAGLASSFKEKDVQLAAALHTCGAWLRSAKRMRVSLAYDDNNSNRGGG